MEPWKDPVARGRRALLRLDLHPIVDHFSISFAASAFVLSLFVLVLPDLFRQTVTGLLRGLVGVLPLAVLASFVTGLFDGKAQVPPHHDAAPDGARSSSAPSSSRAPRRRPSLPSSGEPTKRGCGPRTRSCWAPPCCARPGWAGSAAV